MAASHSFHTIAQPQCITQHTTATSSPLHATRTTRTKATNRHTTLLRHFHRTAQPRRHFSHRPCPNHITDPVGIQYGNGTLAVA